MSKRWTIEELQDTDDITFAMSILSERRNKLNQEAPLAQKLLSAYNTLNDLQPENSDDFRQRIYYSVQREHDIQDIKIRLVDLAGSFELHGLSCEEISNDDEMIDSIMLYYKRSGVGDEFWATIDASVDAGVLHMLEQRGKASC